MFSGISGLISAGPSGLALNSGLFQSGATSGLGSGDSSSFLSSLFGNSGADIMGGADIFGALMGANASKSAAGAQSAADQEALALQEQIYQNTVANMAPYVSAGNGALSSLNALLGLGGGTGTNGTNTKNVNSILNNRDTTNNLNAGGGGGGPNGGGGNESGNNSGNGSSNITNNQGMGGYSNNGGYTVNGGNASGQGFNWDGLAGQFLGAMTPIPGGAAAGRMIGNAMGNSNSGLGYTSTNLPNINIPGQIDLSGITPVQMTQGANGQLTVTGGMYGNGNQHSPGAQGFSNVTFMPGASDFMMNPGHNHGGGYAKGGNTSGTFMVGEHGPEIVKLDKGSTGFVVPNPQTAAQDPEARMNYLKGMHRLFGGRMGHRDIGGFIGGAFGPPGGTPTNTGLNSVLPPSMPPNTPPSTNGNPSSLAGGNNLYSGPSTTGGMPPSFLGGATTVGGPQPSSMPPQMTGGPSTTGYNPSSTPGAVPPTMVGGQTNTGANTNNQGAMPPNYFNGGYTNPYSTPQPNGGPTMNTGGSSYGSYPMKFLGGRIGHRAFGGYMGGNMGGPSQQQMAAMANGNGNQALNRGNVNQINNGNMVGGAVIPGTNPQVPGAAVNSNLNNGNLNGTTYGSTLSQNLTQNPAYQFDFGQGLQAIDNSAAANGNTLSGGTLQALTQYGQGEAANSYQNIYNNLMGMAGLGEAAAAGQASSGVYSGMGMANSASNAGSANANGIMNANNAYMSGLANLGYTFGMYGGGSY